jgi:hypothetical protein
VTDEASSDLSRQVNERRENHKQLLEDVRAVKGQVAVFWQMIGKVASCVHRSLLIHPVLSWMNVINMFNNQTSPSVSLPKASLPSQFPAILFLPFCDIFSNLLFKFKTFGILDSVVSILCLYHVTVLTINLFYNLLFFKLSIILSFILPVLVSPSVLDTNYISVTVTLSVSALVHVHNCALYIDMGTE